MEEFLTPLFARRYTDRWLETCSNAGIRQIIALNDRTRLTDLLVFFYWERMFDFEEIEGIVEDITFQNSENGFTVLEFSSGGESFTATGILGSVYPGEKLIIDGRWETHHSFGRQFKIEGCKRGIPEIWFSYLKSPSV